MATEAITIDRLPEEERQSTITSVKKTLIVGAALFFELTQFHALLEEFAVNSPAYSLAGGGAEPRPESVSLALAPIVRVLSMMPHRLSYEMERAQITGDSSSD